MGLDGDIGSSQVDEDDGDDDSEEERVATGGKMRPLAERLLPKPRKTGVEDMLRTPQYPTVSREMRIVGEKPASGFEWGDYEDVQGTSSAGGDEDEGGWGVVKTKKPKALSSSVPSLGQPAASSSSSAPSFATLTKKQRQNAAKRAAEKEVKAASEKERVEALKKHQREVEKARMAELAKQRGSGKGKVSGGMSASVDEGGRLVWN